MLKEIGKGSGVVIAAQDERLVIIDRGTSKLFTLVFVLGLLTAIPGLAGVAFAAQRLLGVGLGLFGAGIGFGVFFFATLRKLRQRDKAPLDELPPLLIVDQQTGMLLDASGQQLAPLEKTRFSKRFQFGSSSPALVVNYPGGERVIARGHGLMGGLGSLPGVLARRGLMG